MIDCLPRLLHTTPMLTGSKRFLAIALFTLLLIAAVNITWWLYYRQTESMLERSLSRRLISVVQSTAVAIPPAAVDSLVTGDIQAYSTFLSGLRKIASADSLSELFILDDNLNYLVSSSPEPESTYFLAELNAPFTDSLLFGMTDRAIATTTYRTGDLYLKSAFAPLKGKSGAVVALLGVESNVDYFDSLVALKRNLWYASILSLVGGLVLGGLFLWLQRNLNKAEQQLFLGQTHAYLGRMVAVVAHEVRNPLMIIRASAERLLRKADSEEARYVVEETDRLNAIVSGYLDFAKAQGPMLSIEQPEPIDLAEFAEGIKRHVEQRYDQPICWLEPSASPPPRFTGYRRSLRQVILNLLLNGAEACLAAGRPIELGLSVAPNSHHIRITIADHGPGIARKELKKLFTPFYTTRQAGSGLGLYLSRRIVTEMGGTLTIESRTGAGTSVIIELPKEPKN